MRKTFLVCGGRRNKILAFPLVAWSILALLVYWRLSRVTSRGLLPQYTNQEQSLAHFKTSRSLRHYLDNIKLLIEPSSPPCANLEEVPVIILVTSAPSHYERRDASRQTWAKHLPTYFILGLDSTKSDDQLIENYMEAKQHDDLIVYDFYDHYQNLTLKTALMMQWTLDRCPHAEFMYKLDDDVLVNPWVLKQVLKENVDAKLLGYALNNTVVYRDSYNKWYLPRWLSAEDVVPQFLTGPGYLISGDYIRLMMQAAYQVPMINLEDVYFTYLVAKSLRIKVTHESRLAPYRPWPPWLPIPCAYWVQASIHSVGPQEVVRIWGMMQVLGKEYVIEKKVCQFYTRFVKRFVYVY